MADLEAVLADVSYLMAMEKSKSSNNQHRASRKMTLPDPSVKSVMLRHLQDRDELRFDVLIKQRLAYLLFKEYCQRNHDRKFDLYHKLNKLANLYNKDDRREHERALIDSYFSSPVVVDQLLGRPIVYKEIVENSECSESRTVEKVVVPDTKTSDGGKLVDNKKVKDSEKNEKTEKNNKKYKLNTKHPKAELRITSKFLRGKNQTPINSLNNSKEVSPSKNEGAHRSRNSSPERPNSPQVIVKEYFMPEGVLADIKSRVGKLKSLHNNPNVQQSHNTQINSSKSKSSTTIVSSSSTIHNKSLINDQSSASQSSTLCSTTPLITSHNNTFEGNDPDLHEKRKLNSSVDALKSSSSKYNTNTILETTNNTSKSSSQFLTNSSSQISNSQNSQISQITQITQISSVTIQPALPSSPHKPQHELTAANSQISQNSVPRYSEISTSDKSELPLSYTQQTISTNISSISPSNSYSSNLPESLPSKGHETPQNALKNSINTLQTHSTTHSVYKEFPFQHVQDYLQLYLKHSVYPQFIKSDQFARFTQWKNVELSIQLGMNDFSVHRIIGRGGFGEVYGCRKADTGKMYAMKCLDKKRIKLKQGEMLALNERFILQLVSSGSEVCNFIVGMTYAFTTPYKVCFLLDLMNGGDLHYHLTQHIFTEEEVRFYVAEVALGLEHMHSRGVVYRDLKPANILLAENGHVRISDLGLACDFLHKRPHASVGTHGYMAPEVLQRGVAYDSSADWFSLGCMIYKLLRGHSPFRPHRNKDKYEIDRLTLVKEVEMPQTFSEELKDL